MYFCFFRRCASPQFHKFESLISFNAQAEYESELGKYYHNTICKPYLIHISQESAHITGLLDQYIQYLALCRLTQRAYQIPTIFVSETYSKLYQTRCDLAILDLPIHSLYLSKWPPCAPSGIIVGWWSSNPGA